MLLGVLMSLSVLSGEIETGLLPMRPKYLALMRLILGLSLDLGLPQPKAMTSPYYYRVIKTYA